MFFAMVKLLEDQVNVENDTAMGLPRLYLSLKTLRNIIPVTFP
jgi:hypothetical protein